MRTVAITLLSAYFVLAMLFGYGVALHRAVDGFDQYGQEIARRMVAGANAYDDALADVRIGIALAFVALFVLAATGRTKKGQ